MSEKKKKNRPSELERSPTVCQVLCSDLGGHTNDYV